jgi:hypothetical protein
VGPEQDEEDSHPNESIREKSMSIKLKVENTVRWRWIKDEFGQDVSACLITLTPFFMWNTETPIKQSDYSLV